MAPRYPRHGGYLPREYHYEPPATSATQDVLEEFGLPIKKLYRYASKKHYAAGAATVAGYAWKHRKQAAFAYNALQRLRAARIARADERARIDQHAARGTPIHRGLVRRGINFETTQHPISAPRKPRRPGGWRWVGGEL